MTSSLPRVCKRKQLLVLLVLCATVGLFLWTALQRSAFCLGSGCHESTVELKTRGRDMATTVPPELHTWPLSVRYNGTPISEMYQQGFDVDTAACPNYGSGVEMVVVVHSTNRNEGQRMAIRHTWGSVNRRRDVVLVFLMGKSLSKALQQRVRDEAQTYRDVIVSRNFESYINLTLKTVAMSEWVSRRCPRARFFLKMDDDMFFNVPRFLEFLRRPEVSTANRTIFGRLTRETHPVRTPGHRYYISEEEYPGDTYLHYMLGGCYLVTGDISRDLHQVSLRGKFFRMEDIFFTGLMAERLGVRKVGIDNFVTPVYMVKSSVNNSEELVPCDVRRQIAIHSVYDDKIFRMWHMIFDNTLKC